MGYHKRDQKNRDFVGLSRKMLLSQEWLSLPNCAKLAYVYFKKNYNGFNNGEIVAPYKELKKVLKSSATISKAIKTLENKQWIETTEQGGLFQKVSRYRLTFLYDPFYPKPKKRK